MAAAAGIKTTTKSASAGAGAKGAGKKKPNKLLLFGGLGLGAVLLLAHGGSSGGSSNQADQLATGELDAYQQGIQDAGNLAGLSTGSAGVGSSGGGGDSGSGGGNGSSPSGTAVPLPGTATGIGPININVPGSGSNTRSQPRGGAKGKGKSGKGKGAGKPSPVQDHDSKDKDVKPAQGAKGKAAPANKKGKNKNTGKVNSKGYKKKSPVEVQDPRADGYGVQVYGRSFPGALSHRSGPPRSIPGVGIVRDVTVIYGGHSETHTFSHATGTWLDHTRGRNPLSGRTVPHLVKTSEVG